MRLLITGASGFVGAATLAAALKAGHEVMAPVRPESRAHRLDPFVGQYQRVAVDLRDTAGLTAAMAAFKPDVVLHLAWWGVANAARFERRQVSDNIEAACALIEAAAASGAGGIWCGHNNVRRRIAAPHQPLWRGKSGHIVFDASARRAGGAALCLAAVVLHLWAG